MKRWKKLTVILLAVIMALAMAVPVSAATVKINKTKVTICTGQTMQLKMVGTKAKPKWSSNSRNVIVNSAGKVTAKARGTATIIAKIGKKRYRCLVTVEAPRISNSNISLYKGKTAQLKMLNTKQKYRWTSSNTKVAAVSSTGKISGKNVGIAYISARSASGKTFKCKVMVKNRSNKPKGSITYYAESAPYGAVGIFRNNYDYAVDMEVTFVYYLNGVMVGRSQDRNFAFAAHSQCAMQGWNSDLTWDSFKISIKTEKTYNIITNTSGITYNSNFGSGNVMVEVRNNGKKNSSTQIGIVFYKNNKIVGCDSAYPHVENPGDTDYVEFKFPFDLNDEDIVPDRYKIYVNNSYIYTWER